MTASPVPVIGIVGGIGSGKSEVARALGRLGCVVADSDAMAREILRRPDVRDQLMRWWGDSIIGGDGHADRAAVARIVFADPAQRARLEGLVHPHIHAARAEMIRTALDRGVAGVVIDAPLLYEAGVDRECDAVIFVESPRELRAARVRQSRGWSDQELSRRESAQLPLEEKRRRARFVVDNSGGIAEIDRQARTILQALIAEKQAERRAAKELP